MIIDCYKSVACFNCGGQRDIVEVSNKEAGAIVGKVFICRNCIESHRGRKLPVLLQVTIPEA